MGLQTGHVDNKNVFKSQYRSVSCQSTQKIKHHKAFVLPANAELIDIDSAPSSKVLSSERALDVSTVLDYKTPKLDSQNTRL